MIKNGLFVLFFLVACDGSTKKSSIKVVGKMSDVMWKGDLGGKIASDSLNNREAYGLGPIEFLKGEVLLFEGQTYVSKVIDSFSHEVLNVPSAKAPFFVYTTSSNLNKDKLAIKNYSLQELEKQIDSSYKNYDQPMLVRIDGIFDQIKLHSVNLPEGKKVSSLDDAHQGLTSFEFQDLEGSLIGFFSRHHKAIFTHHDRFFHAHFISNDRKILGHVDELNFNATQVSLQVSK